MLQKYTKKISLGWLFIGVAAGIIALPKVLKATGLGQFGWNPNFGTWRPIGYYSIGEVYSGGPNLGQIYSGGPGLGAELLHYAGSQSLGGELLQYRGAQGLGQLFHGPSLGQAFYRGYDLLPFGIPGEYKGIYG
jgi:hypothetical protein